jgi:hypothetical protein
MNATPVRSLGSQAQALLLHRRIKKVKDEVMSEFRAGGFLRQFENKVESIFKHENVSAEAMGYLRLYLKGEREMTERQKMEFTIRETMRRTEDRVVEADEHRIPLKLTSAGDLYRNSKDTHCYRIQHAKIRLKIVRILLDRKGFCHSKELADLVSCASYASLTNAIRGINSLARKHLILPSGQNLIIARRSHGYMLNDLYPISEE